MKIFLQTSNAQQDKEKSSTNFPLARKIKIFTSNVAKIGKIVNTIETIVS
jgi:hypothetical protein